MRKLFLLLTGLLVAALAQAQATSVVRLLPDPTLYGSQTSNTNEVRTFEVEGGHQFKVNYFKGETGQMKVNGTFAGAFSLLNTTPLPGITKITIKARNTGTGTVPGNFCVKTGSQVISTSCSASDPVATVTDEGNKRYTIAFDLSENPADFFRIQVSAKWSSYTLLAEEILIEYAGAANPPAELEAPVITAACGDVPFEGSTTFTITAAGEADIFYTLDGSDPQSSASRSAYDPLNPPAPITRTTTVKAVAQKEGKYSPVAERTITQMASARPVIAVAENPFTADSTLVSITAADGASIYYTLDGSAPTTESTLYSGPVVITETTTVIAIAIEPGRAPSLPDTLVVEKYREPAAPWLLVSDSAGLHPGAEYIIASCGNGRAVGSGPLGGNALTGLDTDIVDGALTPIDGLMVFVLEPGTGDNAGRWAFRAKNYSGTGGPYLGNSGSGSTSISMKADTVFTTVEFLDNHNTRIRFNPSDTRQILQCDGFFKYYASSNVGKETQGYHTVQLYLNSASVLTPVETPVISVSAAEVLEGDSAMFSISCPTEGAEIYYSLDAAPDSAALRYEAPVVLHDIRSDVVISALARKEGMAPSAVATRTIVCHVPASLPAPEFRFEGDTVFTDSITVGAIIAANGPDGAPVPASDYVVRYTTGDTAPDALSPVLTSLVLTETTTLNIAAFPASDSLMYRWRPSAAVSMTFTRFVPTMPALPVVSFGGQTAEDKGIYTVSAGTEVTVACADATGILVSRAGMTDTVANPYAFVVDSAADYRFAGINEYGAGDSIEVGFRIKVIPTYVVRKVVDAAMLRPGRRYVLGLASREVAMGTAEGDYRRAAAATFTTDSASFTTAMRTPDGDAMILTLGGTTDAWTFTADNYTPDIDNDNGLILPASGNKITMGEAPSANVITFSDGSARISLPSRGNVRVCYNTSSPRFGYYTESASLICAELYEILDTVPSAPVVTYADSLATLPGAAYDIVNATTLRAVAEGATSFVIGTCDGEREVAAPAGEISMTIDVSGTYVLRARNAFGLSEPYALTFSVSYRAATFGEMLRISKAHPDSAAGRTTYAVVSFTGQAYVAGHYVYDGREMIWAEDVTHAAPMAMLDEDSLRLPESMRNVRRAMFIGGFAGRAATLNGRDALHITLWPDSADIQPGTDFAIGSYGGGALTEEHLYRMFKFRGDIDYAAGTIALRDASGELTGASLRFGTPLGRHHDAPAPAPLLAEGDGAGNGWKPGTDWPATGTATDVYVAGIVVPAPDGTLVVAPAQVAKNEGDITDVDPVDAGRDTVTVADGVIVAPGGSQVFSAAGLRVPLGTRLPSGVYMVVTPTGRVDKVYVR